MWKYFTCWKQCYNTMCSDTKYGTLIMKAEDIFAYNVVIINCSRSVRGYGKKRLWTNIEVCSTAKQMSKCFSNHIVENNIMLLMLKRSQY